MCPLGIKGFPQGQLIAGIIKKRGHMPSLLDVFTIGNYVVQIKSFASDIDIAVRLIL